MPAVVTFWRLPEEEHEFLDFLDRTGGVLAAPFETVSDRELIRLRPFRDVVAKYARLVLVPASLAHDVRVKTADDGARAQHTIDVFQSPVVIYERGDYRNPKELGASNLSAYWTYANPEGTALNDKPEPFVRWAKRVFRWVRDHTPYWHEYKSYRITPRVAEKIKHGLTLVP